MLWHTLAFLACSGDKYDSAGVESDADTDTDTDSDTDSDTDTDTDTDSDTDTDTDTDTPDPDTFTDYTAAFDFDMVPIAAGTFTMGAYDKYHWEAEPPHEVTLTRGFWIARTEITQAQWDNWTTAPYGNPSAHKDCDDCPVDSISWYLAHQYANAASSAGGLELCYLEDGSDLVASLGGSPYECAGYRLPTEAEWEYAARAGESFLYAGSDDYALVAWTEANSGDHSHPVAQLEPNAWGL